LIFEPNKPESVVMLESRLALSSYRDEAAQGGVKSLFSSESTLMPEEDELNYGVMVVIGQH